MKSCEVTKAMRTEGQAEDEDRVASSHDGIQIQASCATIRCDGLNRERRNCLIIR